MAFYTFNCIKHFYLYHDYKYFLLSLELGFQRSFFLPRASLIFMSFFTWMQRMLGIWVCILSPFLKCAFQGLRLLLPYVSKARVPNLLGGDNPEGWHIISPEPHVLRLFLPDVRGVVCSWCCLQTVFSPHWFPANLKLRPEAAVHAGWCIGLYVCFGSVLQCHIYRPILFKHLFVRVV